MSENEGVAARQMPPYNRCRRFVVESGRRSAIILVNNSTGIVVLTSPLVLDVKHAMAAMANMAAKIFMSVEVVMIETVAVRGAPYLMIATRMKINCET